MAVKKATWSQKSTGDILHPETEVDQLKATGSNALATIITTLLKAATTSEARQAIESAAAIHQHSTGDIQSFASNVITAIGEETLSALGVRYSITTNGYICFGQLFGGLILQWALISPQEYRTAGVWVYPVECATVFHSNFQVLAHQSGVNFKLIYPYDMRNAWVRLMPEDDIITHTLMGIIIGRIS